MDSEAQLAGLNEVAGATFDFVIVGGGTAGLVLAARLSEDPALTVAVLEAGKAHLDDPLVVSAMGYWRQWLNPEYDWAFMTVPQAQAGGQTFPWFRGKGLGGSSAMNAKVWNRAQREDIEAYEALGNTGWTWGRFLEYSKKTESFCLGLHSRPEDAYSRDSVGVAGPVSVSYQYFTSGAEELFRKSLVEHGIPINTDAHGGNALGTWKSPHCFDPETGARSYSANAYLQPALGRPNLRVLTEAYVTKVATSLREDGLVVATGVEFEHGGEIYAVRARKEVVLSAGAIKSPQILELSGIGDRAVLEPLGIPVQVDLAGVGRNVQEHITHHGLLYEMKDGLNIATSDLLLNPEFRAKLLESDSKLKEPLDLCLSGLAFVPLQMISDKADELIARFEAKMAREARKYPRGLKEQYEYQLKMLKNPKVPDIEIIVTPYSLKPAATTKPIVCIAPTLSRPFSRGTIHVSSTDPKEHPIIDPKYFDEEVDLELMVEAWKFVRKVADSGAFKDATVAEVAPGPAAVSTDEQIVDYSRTHFVTTWHTFGTVSMLPREKGGVVDSELKVYGTANVRVVDLSVVPISVTTHTQATVYTIAEQAADIIKCIHLQ